MITIQRICACSLIYQISKINFNFTEYLLGFRRRGVKPVRNNLFFVWAKCEREFCPYAIFLSKICHTMVGYGYYTYHNNHFLFHSIQVLKNLFDYLLILLLRSSFVAAYRILCFWYKNIFWFVTSLPHWVFCFFIISSNLIFCFFVFMWCPNGVWWIFRLVFVIPVYI